MTISNHEEAPEGEFRPATILAFGGLLICLLVVAQDPVARESCRRVGQDDRVREHLTRAIRWLFREAANELERGV